MLMDLEERGQEKSTPSEPWAQIMVTQKEGEK